MPTWLKTERAVRPAKSTSAKGPPEALNGAPSNLNTRFTMLGSSV